MTYTGPKESPGVRGLTKAQIERKGLPDKAPELWRDRNRALSESAPMFVKRVYAEWLDKGLTRADISKLDRQLAVAISDWLIPQGRKWPEEVDLPSTREWKARAVETYRANPDLVDPTLASKLQAAIRYREARLREQDTEERLAKLALYPWLNRGEGRS